jgi:predicted nuclease of predicted toxin-antitoxin system
MKILLDECLPRSLAKDFPLHDVHTVPQMGWSGTSNGKLLELAADQFDAFVTMDSGLRYQQNISQKRIAVVTLHARSNRSVDLRPLVPAVLAALPTAHPGTITRIAAPGYP